MGSLEPGGGKRGTEQGHRKECGVLGNGEYKIYRKPGVGGRHCRYAIGVLVSGPVGFRSLEGGLEEGDKTRV